MKDETRRRTMWISDDLWKRVTAAAKKDDRSISSWFRQVIETALEIGKL